MDYTVLIPRLIYYRLHANNSYGQQNNKREEWHRIAEKLYYEVLQNIFIIGRFLMKENCIFICLYRRIIFFLLLTYFITSARQ